MHDSKDIGPDAASTPEEPPAEERVPANAESATNDDGWQQYRRWISKAPAPVSRRNGLDPSLYTWKGYRNWAKQVKRNWSSDT